MTCEEGKKCDILKPGDIVSIATYNGYDVTVKILKNDTEKQLLTYRMLDEPIMCYSCTKYIGTGIETESYSEFYDFEYTEDPSVKFHRENMISLNPVTKEKIKETFYGLTNFDYGYKICNAGNEIGTIILSELSESEQGPIFIEWIELSDDNRGKGYMRSIIEHLKELFQNRSSIMAECSDKYLSMYRHFGFGLVEYDDFREMNTVSLYIKEPELFERRIIWPTIATLKLRSTEKKKRSAC